MSERDNAAPREGQSGSRAKAQSAEPAVAAPQSEAGELGRLHELLYTLRYSDFPADGDYARGEIIAMFLHLIAENAAMKEKP